MLQVNSENCGGGVNTTQDDVVKNSIYVSCFIVLYFTLPCAYNKGE